MSQKFTPHSAFTINIPHSQFSEGGGEFATFTFPNEHSWPQSIWHVIYLAQGCPTFTFHRPNLHWVTETNSKRLCTCTNSWCSFSTESVFVGRWTGSVVDLIMVSRIISQEELSHDPPIQWIIHSAKYVRLFLFSTQKSLADSGHHGVNFQ